MKHHAEVGPQSEVCFAIWRCKAAAICLLGGKASYGCAALIAANQEK
ncbi:hypothetical protein DSM3645_00110 [Blastopirellula marina DSM 3645]|uniref:Uncharacterized protein n=1 Tax=Blastopirellula marina DSM 3645 TaxID=314230 RepID=A3ZMA1_9BACT|nr:hypothetical protein DSM3645_00110 [Blastopirellula marina DSM 3645]